MANTIPRKKAQRWLTVLCMSTTLLTVVILADAMQDNSFIGSDNKSYALHVWTWCCPYILPTLGIMLGTLVDNAEDGKKKMADKFLFYLCFISLLIYSIILVGSLGHQLQRLGRHDGQKNVDITDVLTSLEPISLVLTGCQTIIGLLLGHFFTKTATA